MTYFNRQKFDNLQRGLIPSTLTPSRSAEILPNFNAKNVYSYLCDNSIPMQNSPYNTLSHRNNQTNVSPKQILFQNVKPRQTQNYFVGQNTSRLLPQQRLENQSYTTTNKSQTNITGIKNQIYEIPRQVNMNGINGTNYVKILQKPQAQDKITQTQYTKINSSSQTQNKVFTVKQTQSIQHASTDSQTQTKINPQNHAQSQTDNFNMNLSLVSPNFPNNKSDFDLSPKKESQMFASGVSSGQHLMRNTQQNMVDLFGLKKSLNEEPMKPRQAVSFFEAKQMQASSINQESLTLMQLVFLNDAYVFSELEELQKYSSVKKLINLVSLVLDEQLNDLDPTSYVENQVEVNGRARLTLKLFAEVINKSIEAFERQDGDSQLFDQQGFDEALERQQTNNNTSPSNSQQEYQAPWENRIDEPKLNNKKLQLNQYVEPFQNEQKINFIQAKSTLSPNMNTNLGLQREITFFVTDSGSGSHPGEKREIDPYKEIQNDQEDSQNMQDDHQLVYNDSSSENYLLL